LENRATFLRDLSEKVCQRSIAEQEDKLIKLLQSTGTSQSAGKELVAVKHPELFGDGLFSGPSRSSFNMKQMLACSMHLGHATHKWNPKMAPFLHGERQGIHIIDLEKTLACLRVACQVVTDIVARGGSVLFVGTREPIRRLTYEAAVDAGQCYVNLRWLGGTVSNRTNVLRNDQLLPDLLIVLDYPNNVKAVVEANRANIPIVAICDSDCDPARITYPVPANDDAFASVELVARVLSLAATEGRTRRTHQSSVVASASRFVSKVF
jgi:small subunit ribosomal protein S2